MDTYINILKGQLEEIVQSNKKFKGSRGETGKKFGSIILAKNLLKLEKIILSALDKLATDEGIDIEKCRKEI